MALAYPGLSPRLDGHLQRIVSARLAWASGGSPQEILRRLPRTPRPPARSLVAALRQARAGWEQGLSEGPVPVIAEVKRRSPSAGAIAEQARALAQALRYRQAGAAAVSVLAEEAFFGGSPEDVAEVVRGTDLPVLYKDVVVHPVQLELALACGAAAVLLIAAVFDERELARRVVQARRMGLEVVVEVHHEEELDAALTARPDVVGINNRDLTTFRVDPDRAQRLLARIPPGPVRIAESGYQRPDQARRALEAGASAVLIGEALMRSPDPASFLQAVRRRQGVNLPGPGMG